MQRTVQFIETYTVVACANCGISFAITTDFEQRRREDHKGFYCPAGHSNIYDGETEAEKLKKQLAKEKKARESAEKSKEWWAQYADEKVGERDEARKKLGITRGQLTKAKKRAAHGVCPCCTRTFANVQRHIENKHPDYVATVNAETEES